uniref:Uncharacterized protein n=1 Tax=Eptatretus burgeri TaxID=7764 RepID=A0A8C4QQZ0_EPTBU
MMNLHPQTGLMVTSLMLWLTLFVVGQLGTSHILTPSEDGRKVCASLARLRVVYQQPVFIQVQGGKVLSLKYHSLKAVPFHFFPSSHDFAPVMMLRYKSTTPRSGDYVSLASRDGRRWICTRPWTEHPATGTKHTNVVPHLTVQFVKQEDMQSLSKSSGSLCSCLFLRRSFLQHHGMAFESAAFPGWYLSHSSSIPAELVHLDNPSTHPSAIFELKVSSSQ